ncbi:type I polyketide synthase [Algiphilus aromaticivorans]|uniref:type I polyketide synthase n=1 Tax=Algiphilus aromaticivorans TaxID=382454 RepID=UPI0005C194C6|nr:type I polyketide synthase [Algiphilus aromaticivorans]
MTQRSAFDVITLSPATWSHPGVAVSAARAGGVGVIDLEFSTDPALAAAHFARLVAESAHGEIGLRVVPETEELAVEIIAAAPAERPLVLIAGGPGPAAIKLARALRKARGKANEGDRLYLEVTDADTKLGQLKPDGIIAKGFEAPGWGGEDSSYVLAQKWLARTQLPLLVRGGVGQHAAAALRAAGAAGVVLDDQVLLCDETPLPSELKAELARLNGSETRSLGELLGAPCRVYARPGSEALETAQNMLREAEAAKVAPEDWRARLMPHVGWGEGQLRPVGQGVGVGAAMGQKRVARVIKAIRKQSFSSLRIAAQQRHLAEGAPLAASHGTRYPLVQGPMTRVSDHAQFAADVAEAGALPFLALALMRGEQVDELLAETAAKAGDRAWGVGMLGFVPQALRDEQCEAIWKHKPPFALIAGGRPDQAQQFESRGIPAYIHVPAPQLLKMYYEQGARRFVFEGRECGGHIGPIASFPLWEQMIAALLDAVDEKSAPEVHVLFAGGISDDVSGAMLAALTAPLAERGIRVGGLMGTAYLFTKEIVSSGAIVQGYQDEALACRHTTSLETGPGHATRCVDTAFAREFFDKRRELLAAGQPAEEIRDTLEDMNLGRLRLASKGRTRNDAGEIITIDAEQQKRDGMYMIGQVATMRDQVVSCAELHENVSAHGTQRLLDLESDVEARREAASPSDVAVVGIGTVLPGAGDADSFWHNVVEKVSIIREVPRERWDWRLYFDPDMNARDKVYSKWGGFLDEITFDPLRFGIPPRSMKSIDPMQLLSLECTARALDDAGFDDDFDRENTSVILGAGGGVGDLGMQYGVRAELPRFVEIPDDGAWERLPEWTNESFAGVLQNVAAGRVANRMDFGGLNFTVDAACGSSLAAVTLATQELEAGRSSIAIAGGVDTVQGPHGFLCFSKTQALSPKGIPRTFDKNADGIAISEGVALVVLKRLADAEADGDRIYAVIKGAAGSSDGKALGMTAPRPEGQIRALDRVYRKAGFGQETVELVEAHGTGTAVGDRAEAETITRSWRDSGAPAKSVALGSIKTILGHTKCAAGVSGLIKVALSLHHRVLPAHVGVEDPIDVIAADDSPAYLLDEPRPWLRSADHPRRGAVSAFGFGGTNFHAVLEEYRGGYAVAEPVGARRWPWELFVFRAADAAALQAQVEKLGTALAAGDALGIAEIAHTLAAEAEQVPEASCVAAFAADSHDTLRKQVEALRAHLAENKALPPGVRCNLQRRTRQRVGLLFPGQGAQSVGMGREVALYRGELREALEYADAVLGGSLHAPLSSLMWPEAAFNDAAREAQQQAITNTRHAQPAIGALSLGYLDLLRRLGIAPDAVAGHSYGEYTALHAAGVIDRDAFLRLSAARGAAMADAAGDNAGAMAAVQASREQVDALLADAGRVWVANHNAPEQVVISGEADAVDAVIEKAKQQQLRATRLPVSGAFHTELVAAAQAPLSAAIDATHFSAPQCKLYGNHGSAHSQDPAAIVEQLKGHLLAPVEFVSELQAMADDGIDCFIECGPKAICAGMAGATLAEQDVAVVSLDGQGGGLRGLLNAVGDLLCAGVDVPVTRLMADRGIARHSLAALAGLLKPAEVPATAFYLSGGCARPKDDPERRAGSEPPLTLERQQAVRERAKAAAATPAAPAAAAAGEPQAPAARPQAPAMPATPTAADASGFGQEALAAYQQTMQQFLQLQEQVMSRVLGGQPAQPAAGQPAMPAQTVAAAAAPQAAVPEAAPQPAVQAPPVAESPVAPAPSAPAEPAFDAKAALLALVADRTGYPEDMIGLDADLEADLGIDSIKRVEIVGAFAKEAPTAIAGAMQADMERYTSARSLTALLAQLPEVASSPSGAAAPAAAPSAPSFDAKAALLALMADRTGYPEDMIGLDADLEADLGIDSIKRVEIVGAFAKEAPAAIADAMQADMERFTSARSLTALLAELPEVASAPAATASAATAAAAATSSDFDAKSVLLALVADRTGYPEDMIGLDADLEADLGIDSIKRVEIVGAFAKEAPTRMAEAMQADMERFTAARSLTALLDELAAAGAGAAPEGAAAQPAATTAPEATPAQTEAGSDGVARYVIRPRQIAPVQDGVTLSGNLLILGEAEGGPNVLALRARAETAGLTVVVIDAEDEAGIAEGLAVLDGPIAGVALLHGLQPAPAEGMDAQLDAGRHAVGAAFACLRAFGERVAGLRLVAATRLGGTLGRDAVSDGAPVAGGIVGLLNCARQEFPDAHLRPVDFNGQTPESIANLLITELGSTEQLPEVGYVGDARYTSATVAEPLQDTRFAPHLEPQGDWVVLATGGARGITASILQSLALPGMTMVLAGRSARPEPESPELAAAGDEAALKKLLLQQARAAGDMPKPAEIDRAVARVLANREIRSALEGLEAAGVTVDYRAIDVRDGEAVQALVDDVHQRYGRLDAVLHGAGIIEDKLLVDKTPESFERVFSTKVDSAVALAKALHPESLKLLVFFTSVAGRYGNRGQSDYAAANEALNRLAWQLSRRWKQTRVVSLNWGPWDAGMATEAVKQAFRSRGVIPIPLDAGCKYFLQEISYGPRHEVEVVVGEGPWNAAEGGVPADARPAPGSALLRGELRMGSGGALELEQTVSLESDPWLVDHQLDGIAVVPATAAAEWLAAVAEAGWPGWQLHELRDLRVLSGIRLDDNQPKRILLRARASSHSDAGGQIVKLEILDPENKNRACYRANAHIVERLPEPPELPADIAALGADAQAKPAGEAYADWLFHGPRFQRMQGELQLSPQGVDATLVASHPEEFGLPGSGWILDPALLDCLPQLAWVWSRHCHDTSALPTGVGSIRRFAGALPGEGLRVIWRARDDSSAEYTHYDAWVVDGGGRVRLVFENAESNASKALNRLAGA